MVKKIRKINPAKRKANRELAKNLATIKKEVDEEREKGMKLILALSFDKEYCSLLPTPFALQFINLNSKPILMVLNKKGFTGINVIIDLKGETTEVSINEMRRSLAINSIKNTNLLYDGYDWLLVVRIDNNIMQKDLMYELCKFVAETDFNSGHTFIFSPDKIFNCFHSSFNPENISNDLMKIMKETGEEKAIKLVE
jgi:hypothetical protein